MVKTLKLPQLYREAAVWFLLTIPVVINKYLSEKYYSTTWPEIAL